MTIRVEVVSNESLIQRARNFLVSMFMDMAEYTHMMFIDSDVDFAPGHILRMLSKDKDVICGVYPKKSYDMPRLVDLARKYPGLSCKASSLAMLRRSF